MNKKLYYHIEELDQDEISTLKTRLQKEKDVYNKNLWLFYKLALIVILILTGITFAAFYFGEPVERYDDSEPLTPGYILELAAYFSITIFILIFISFKTMFYSFNGKLIRDIDAGTKIIERAIIKDKKFISLNNTFHFYLHSNHKLSVEVDESIYNFYEIGDEFNIEYTTYGKIDLGYH